MRRLPPRYGAGMHAVDTNVVVRYLTGDDARQTARAKAYIDGNEVFVPTTVILETEWILRTIYGFANADIAIALRTFGGQPTVNFEHLRVVWAALDLAERGVDFADALHLAASGHCETFVSFDRALAKTAKAMANLTVREP